MNLPNKLTLSRVIMVPFFVFFLLMIPKYFYFKWIALAIFIVASLTDLLDGKIARKYNLVTNFGKFMDPLADKLLVCSALIGLSSIGRGVVPAWITIVIIAREFIISGFRLIAAEKGVVIAASMWGKFKTTFQMIMICIQLAVSDWYVDRTVQPYIYGRADVPPDSAYSTNITVMLLGIWKILFIAGQVTMYIALILTVVSLIDYLVKNKDVLKDVD